jgi:hypothetical protein
MLLLALTMGSSQAGEFARMQQDPDLSPQRLLSHFAGFAYELGEQLQDPETFLRRGRGDCDDFASLADRLLTERGWDCKLVVVMMERQTHVVCYVAEAEGFLDFNRRAVADPITRSAATLEDIADKVAGSFRSRWWVASEIEYREGHTVFLASAFPPAPPTVAAPIASPESHRTHARSAPPTAAP